MAKYGNFLYGTAKYGSTPKLNLSVEPMDITLLDFSRALITWQSPTGTFTKIKLVRNQIGFPETAEDGIIIWEEEASEGSVSRDYFVDGEDNPESVPIVSGRPIYYSMFLFTDSNVWVRAGDIADIVPLDHGSHQKFLDILPRVYTSDVQSPLAVVDETSALYNFLEGMSFTYEQFLTQLDLLRPRHTADIASHLLLFSEYYSLGLDLEPSISIRNQKRMAREGIYLYSHKGLKNGLETYVESLTGYAPTITVSPNILLSVQDSSFYNSIGNWLTNTCTLEASTAQVPVTTDYVIDSTYSGKVVASGAAYITLGADDPIRKGIPVKADTDYTFSYKIKSPSSAGSTTLTVVWYDRFGVTLGADFVSASTSANNTWKTSWENTTSPADATYASLKISFSASGTYYVDQVYAEEGENLVSTSYQEARAVDVFVSESKTNYIKNPSFETNVTDSWTKSGSATVAQNSSVPSDIYAGTSSAKVTGTGSWTYKSNTFPVLTGMYYTVSGYVKSDANLSVTITARDDSSSETGTTVSSLGTVANWSRFSLTALTDDDTATLEVTFSGSTGAFYLDGIQFERGVAATEYFDGTLPSDYGAIWEGTAHNSYTRLYVGKPYKISRLANTLNSWVPPNTFWRLTSYDGVEYTNLTV